MTDMRRNRVLRASEIGSYAYCARGWWLERVLGLPSAHKEKMELGEKEHHLYGREVVAYHRLQHLGYLMIALGAIAALAVILWWLSSTLLA